MKPVRVSVEYEYKDVSEMFKHITKMQEKGYKVYCGCEYVGIDGFWVKFEKEVRDEN